MLLKDDQEHSVPEALRSKLRKIANGFASGDFQLRNSRVDGVEPIDPAIAYMISANVRAYGDPLAPLDDAIWESSVYRWMEGYWLLLVGLTTEEERVSDLTLHARLYEADGSRLSIESVHVP
jgi:hypothetical protein